MTSLTMEPACPDANLLQALMAGQLGTQERAPLARHLDGCAECRALIASLARAELADEEESPDLARTHDAEDPALAATEGVRGGAEARALAAGDKLGRYVLSARLGAGAMGVVYRALDPQLGREVAIKVLRRPDSLLRERLGREARAMAQVNHPNVVAVYDVGEAQGQVYIAMELVLGQTLRQWREESRRSPQEIVELYRAAGRGLAAAHAAGVVHRDFKPDNVLLGRDGRPRVTDFGMAGALAARKDAATPAGGELELTRSGAILGTPVYMAPEQLTGGNVDPRSDQWAFCVSLFEALHGERPFFGATWDELVETVCAGRITGAGARPPPELERIVRRGLSVRPGDRHDTMDDLLAELGRDRGRPWRRAALACAAVAAAFTIGVATDALLRQRAEAAATQSFRAAGRQLLRAVELRYDSFVALADASYSVPVMHKVLGHKDQSDFGLGEELTDSENLELVHATLASADWLAWAERSSRAAIAVGDYKGRLLYTSAAPERWGAELLALPAARVAFEGGRSRAGGAMVARYDDPRLAVAQLFGPSPPSGLTVVFARALVVGGVPLGLFVQALDGVQLLADVSVDDELELALVAPDGAAIGTVPAELARAISSSEVAEARHHGELRLVQARPLPGLDGAEPIARLVLARRIDPGLSGLFASARVAFALAAGLLLAVAVAAATRARALRHG